MNGKWKEDGFKRERENEMNEGLGREGEQMSVLKGKRKKVKEGSQEVHGEGRGNNVGFEGEREKEGWVWNIKESW